MFHHRDNLRLTKDRNLHCNARTCSGRSSDQLSNLYTSESLCHWAENDITRNEEWSYIIQVLPPPTSLITTTTYKNNSNDIILSYVIPPRVDHLDVVGRLTPSMNGNQEFTAPRSLVSQAGPSHWDECSCWRDLILMFSLTLLSYVIFRRRQLHSMEKWRTLFIVHSIQLPFEYRQ
jgi:hypothetical protein